MLLFDRRFPLSFILLISRWPRLLTLSFLRGSFSSEVRRQREAVFLIGGVEFFVFVASPSSPFPPGTVLDLGTRSTVGGGELSQPRNPPQFKFLFIALLCNLSDLFAVFASPK